MFSKKTMFFYLSQSKLSVLISVFLSLIYLSFLGMFLLKNNSFYIELLKYSTITTLLLIIITYTLYKINYKKLNQLIITNEYLEYKNQITSEFSKYIDKNLFFKLNNLESLLNKRFGITSLFNIRVQTLLNESLKIYINNLKLIKDIDSLNNPLINKEIEIKNLMDNNEKIIFNIDLFIKEIVIETKEDLEVESLFKNFEKNIALFNTLKDLKNPKEKDYLWLDIQAIYL